MSYNHRANIKKRKMKYAIYAVIINKNKQQAGQVDSGL